MLWSSWCCSACQNEEFHDVVGQRAAGDILIEQQFQCGCRSSFYAAEGGHPSHRLLSVGRAVAACQAPFAQQHAKRIAVTFETMTEPRLQPLPPRAYLSTQDMEALRTMVANARALHRLCPGVDRAAVGANLPSPDNEPSSTVAACLRALFPVLTITCVTQCSNSIFCSFLKTPSRDGSLCFTALPEEEC